MNLFNYLQKLMLTLQYKIVNPVSTPSNDDPSFNFTLIRPALHIALPTL